MKKLLLWGATALALAPAAAHAQTHFKINPNTLYQRAFNGSSAQTDIPNQAQVDANTAAAAAAQATASAAIPLAQKGAASGVAALDSSGNLQAPTPSVRGGVTSVTGSNVVVTGIPTSGTPTTAPFIGTTAGTARDAAAAIAAEGAAQATANAAPVTAWSGSGFGFGSVPSAVQVANTQNAPTQDTSGNYQATASDVFICVNLTSPAANTVTLPASPANGRPIAIKDCAGNSATYPITVVPASGTIDGQSSYVVNINFEEVDLVYTGSAWSVR
jgi:hypothetical protein